MKRYGIARTGSGYDESKMVEDKDGEYIKYDDYSEIINNTIDSYRISQSIIEEAKELVNHPSKDVQCFAKSVLECADHDYVPVNEAMDSLSMYLELDIRGYYRKSTTEDDDYAKGYNDAISNILKYLNRE